MHGGQQVVAELNVEQLGHIALHDKVGIQVQHLVVVRHELLDEEAVVRLHADMRIVGGQFVLAHQARYVTELDGHVIEAAREEIGHEHAVLVRDVLLQHHHFVAILLGGVGHHGIHGGGEHGHVVVVRRERHGDHRAEIAFRQHHFRFVMEIRLVEVHALQLLHLPARAGALMVQQEDVEQALGQVSRRAQALLGVQRHVGRLGEFLQNGEQPGAILLEHPAAHDEHVAETSRMARQEHLHVLLILRVTANKNLHHTVKVLDEELGSRIIL